MRYRRMPIEVESPEELGYGTIEINLSESSVWDARLGKWSKNLDEMILCYGAHRGTDELRELIAATSPGLSASDVLVVPGAAAALFIINSSLLEAGSAMLVARPNYSTNIETPRLIRCATKYLDLKFENGFELDLDEVASLLTPDTRLISVTYPHNPTGVVLGEQKLHGLIRAGRKAGCYLLVDETYRDLHRGVGTESSAATCGNSERPGDLGVVTFESVSACPEFEWAGRLLEIKSSRSCS